MTRLLALLLPLQLAAQTTCETATPYPSTLPFCRIISPADDTVSVCFSFVAPTTGILFDAVTTSSCATINRTFILYDGECVALDTNTMGFFDVLVGLPYTVCVELICQGGAGIQQVCVFDPLPLWASLVTIYGGQELGHLFLSFYAASVGNSHFRIMHSMDLYLWTEVGWLNDHGKPMEVQYYRWVGEGRQGVNYLRVYDGHDVLLGQVAIPFSGALGLGHRFNVLGQRVR